MANVGFHLDMLGSSLSGRYSAILFSGRLEMMQAFVDVKIGFSPVLPLFPLFSLFTTIS